jgi:hypothetical protein
VNATARWASGTEDPKTTTAITDIKPGIVHIVLIEIIENILYVVLHQLHHSHHANLLAVNQGIAGLVTMNIALTT